MSKNPVPCLHCPDIGCGAYHDECPKYQAYVKINEEQKRTHKFKVLQPSHGYDHQKKKGPISVCHRYNS